MARTTSAAVIDLLSADYDGTTSLTVHIDTATAMVDRVATCATAKGKTLTTAELELIERWLAAHCYAMVDQPYASKTTGRASATFQGRTGMRLEATKYGQQAIAVDYSGCLNGLDKRATAGAMWMGKTPTEQTDYIDRR